MDNKQRLERAYIGNDSFYSSPLWQYLFDNFGRQGSVGQYLEGVKERIQKVSKQYVEIKITLTILGLACSLVPFIGSLLPFLSKWGVEARIAFVTGQVFLWVRIYWYIRDKKHKARLQAFEEKLRQLEVEERDNIVHPK